MDKIIDIFMSINWETIGAIVTSLIGMMVVAQKWLRKNVSDVSSLMKDNIELKNSNLISQANIVSYNNLIQEFTEFKNTVYLINKTNKSLEANNKKLKEEMELLMKSHEEIVSKMLVEFMKKLKEEGVNNEVQLQEERSDSTGTSL